MNIYHLQLGGTFEEFAQFIATGTWSNDKLTECCRRNQSVLIPPLQVMWIPGSTRIGDLAWSPTVFVVQNSVISIMKALSVEFRIHPIIFNPYDGSAGRLTKKSQIVSLPYTGPELHWLQVTDRVPIDLDASGVSVRKECSVCGHISLTPKRTGLVLPKDQWQGQHVFGLEQFQRSIAVFVTEVAMEQMKHLTNVSFSLAGSIC